MPRPNSKEKPSIPSQLKRQITRRNRSQPLLGVGLSAILLLLFVLFFVQVAGSFLLVFGIPILIQWSQPERSITSSTLPLRLKWQYELDRWLYGQPPHNNKFIYVPQGKRLIALDAETGSEEWVFTGERTIEAGFGIPNIAVAEDAVVFACEEPLRHEIIVLDAQTGRTKWTNVSEMETFYSFAIGDRQVYVGEAGHVVAYDEQTGSRMWQMTNGLPSSHRVIRVYYEEGKLYVTASDAVDGQDRLYVLNARDGRLLGTYPYETAGMEEMSEGTLIAEDGLAVRVVEAKTGTLRWDKRFLSLTTYVAPTLLHDTFYVPPHTGNLYALDANTGDPKWISDKIAEPFSNVVSYNGKGYVASKHGNLYGFDLATGQVIGVIETTPHEFVFEVPFASAPHLPSLIVQNQVLVATFGDSHIYGFVENAP